MCKFASLADNLQLRLLRIGENSRVLVERYRRTDAERREALEKIEVLEGQLADLNKEVQKLRTQVEYLTISSTVAPDRKSLNDTRAIVVDLMREVDRCIADLTEP